MVSKKRDKRLAAVGVVMDGDNCQIWRRLVETWMAQGVHLRQKTVEPPKTSINAMFHLLFLVCFVMFSQVQFCGKVFDVSVLAILKPQSL